MAAPAVAILLMGPTASGKTDLAWRIAQRFPVEIISVDSAQVYRDMDIGTAKPDAWMREGIPHHLIDILPPTESYSAGRFCSDAARLMAEISSRDRIPLLTGGTMMYFNALTKGLNDLPAGNAALRKSLDEMASLHGWPAMHARLASVDPVAASRINANDAQRIQRALEIFEMTGKALSTHFARPAAGTPTHRLISLALMPSDRSWLHDRITQRFDAMLAAGLVDELRMLRERYSLEPTMNSMRCVGYRQAWEHLELATTPGSLREKGCAATRQLAKRQMTWMRSMAGVTMLDPCQSARLETCTYSAVEAGLTA